MSPLFYVAIALSVGAIAVTMHALFSAPEGYEDEEGFHAIRRPVLPKSHSSAAGQQPASDIHPRFSPR